MARVTGPRGEEVELEDGRLAPFREQLAKLPSAPRARIAYAATRVVMRDGYKEVEHAPDAPGFPGEVAGHVDWPATIAQRKRLDRLGFGIAEAMDTAQRFELGWTVAERLIEECGRARLKHGFIAGASADHLEEAGTTREVIEGVIHQCGVIKAAGGQAIVLPLLLLARQQADADTYVRVYGEIVERSDGPLWIHWLGEAFHAELGGYFPGDSFERVMALDPEKVRGAKLSLLDPQREVALRAQLLTRDQIVLTGDDLHFGRLIRGGDPDSASAPLADVERSTSIGGRDVALGNFSHALLGVLDAVAEPVGLALDFLSRGDTIHAMELLTPCEELGRWLFRAPTKHYKAGLAAIAWLNGWQSNRMLANHEERTRAVQELFRTAELASRAGVLTDARLAAERLGSLLASRG